MVVFSIRRIFVRSLSRKQHLFYSIRSTLFYSWHLIRARRQWGLQLSRCRRRIFWLRHLYNFWVNGYHKFWVNGYRWFDISTRISQSSNTELSFDDQHCSTHAHAKIHRNIQDFVEHGTVEAELYRKRQDGIAGVTVPAEVCVFRSLAEDSHVAGQVPYMSWPPPRTHQRLFRPAKHWVLELQHGENCTQLRQTPVLAQPPRDPTESRHEARKHLHSYMRS